MARKRQRQPVQKVQVSLLDAGGAEYHLPSGLKIDGKIVHRITVREPTFEDQDTVSGVSDMEARGRAMMANLCANAETGEPLDESDLKTGRFAEVTAMFTDIGQRFFSAEVVEVDAIDAAA